MTTTDRPESCGAGLEPGGIPARRAGEDRRARRTSPLDALRARGRRGRVRRASEREGAYFLDRFDATTLAMALSLLALTLIDGLLTIEVLDRSGEEINPVMRHFLGRGHGPFLVAKYCLTAAGLPVLVVYQNWPFWGTRFRVGYLLPIFVGLYVALVTYQLRLLGG
ncbi:hypothetical protein OJF2_44060 [Aquisphaera giovannonii]|uniref:DUF5658 domain-containing protein n=1 Tax=Aquisphaera giovannonii TaxID=406548 RepID=A0A5B9W6P9_9BACT|nr:DUF5658 family protein [Aquisphaera giovannonii]QEH35849.1 hypothetical protein OJF2_44060 [Aquisphaera giovannonii]